MIPGLNADKCAQRNRIAALKGYAAGNVRLLSAVPEPERAEPLGATAELLAKRLGKLPRGEAEALAMINALRTGGEALTADDVWIHYAEAANGSFIPDRYMFLGGSTLRNIAADAARGVAFMNSHRTGGLSEPTELPFGRTFCGRYEEDGGGGQRALVGVYLSRGVFPNGDSGPGTDDLHRMIDDGTVFDVSVGLYGGWYLCDICGNDFLALDEDGDYLCQHLPGTDREMTKEQRKAQEARGVTHGYASISYMDGRMGEVSAVYDGAVPGAGFVKAVSLARGGGLDAALTARCREIYSFARPLDFAVRDEGSKTGPSFEEQLSEAVAAVESCTERGEGYQKVSRGRYAQLVTAHERLGALLRQVQPEADERSRRVRMYAIAAEADALRLGV